MTAASIAKSFVRRLISGLVVGGSLVGQCYFPKPIAAADAYCQITPEAAATKETLLQASLEGDSQAKRQYDALIQEQAEQLRQCRSQNWPQTQAIWLRPFPCDVNPGAVEHILDRIVNRGYNQIYLEVFFDGQVLLPPSDNPTPWVPVVRLPGTENTDLLAEFIQKGHERGVQVYAWMYTLNFGYAYAQRPDRQAVLARNGDGESSLSVVRGQSQAFIDPYNQQAQREYYQLLNAVLQRRPDGVLFDYVRYPQGMGNRSVASQVEELWIYGDASRRALYERAQNNKGRALIDRFVSQGKITVKDITAVDERYPHEDSPLWEGRTPYPRETEIPAKDRHQRLQTELWYLSVAHAAQGVIDFLSLAAYPFEQQGIPVGAVFFPEGNRVVGQQGFDSRLQPWDNFPDPIQWHAMSYGVCGNTNCITEQVKRVMEMAPDQAKIIPAIAGVWGEPYKNRPALEGQMQAIHKAAPQVNAISHFAYSWQDPEFNRLRRSCQL